MENIDKSYLDKWLKDPSFINWAHQRDDDDIIKWEQFLNDHTGLWETAKAAKLIICGIPFKPIKNNEAAASRSLDKLLSKIDPVLPQENNTIMNELASGHLSIKRRSIRIASAVAACLVLVFGCVHLFHNPEIKLETNYGEQKQVVLDDGSIITLNANSSITYTKRNPRQINLQGEGFFEVTPKKETNEIFEVHTSDVTVKVYGTSFNVNTRNEKTNIFLEEGEVVLKTDDADNEVIAMKPGDLVSYSNADHKVKFHEKNVSTIENISWKEGSLIFNQTLLPQALYDIEDIYGIQFVIKYDELRKEEITGGVPIGDLNITIETLSTIYGLAITREGKRYFLTKKSN